MKFLALLFFCGFTVASFAQGTQLNQYDSNDKKHGKWTVYLDHHWKEVKDSSEAVYYRYTQYDHGFNIYPMGPCGKKKWKLESTVKPSTQNGPHLLQGEYKWIDDKGRISSVHDFKNGEYQSCKEYDSDQILKQHFDYTRKHKRQPHNYYVHIYDNGKKGKDVSYAMRNGEKGWMLYFEGSMDDL
jgi:hypothetical protein